MNLALKMTAVPESVGVRLTRIREEKGYTQKDLASAVGVSQQTIGNIERKGSGSTRMPEIAEFLGVSITYLMKGEELTEPNLSLVNSAHNSGYSVEEIRERFPHGFDKAISTVRSMLFQQGKLLDGDISLIANKELISSVLLKCILVEITGDLFINENTAEPGIKSSKEHLTKLK